ncbi:MAG: anhydro-N-acetylmuramic acid kinase [Anderseniella sp.]
MANPITAIGLMSGTSMDGIDVAMIRTDGEAHVEAIAFEAVDYLPQQRELLAEAMTLSASLEDRAARPGKLAQIERDLTRWHAQAVDSFRQKHRISDSKDSVIGFHGQTVLHRPEIGLTIQLGDGQELANLTGMKVVADMRANDMAHGGQGAPLVPAYHAALASHLPQRPAAFVNIGGVGNVTFVNQDGSLLAFDTGPGNALMDDWSMRHTGRPVDIDGALARSGKVDEGVLAEMRRHDYFHKQPPKSLDRGSFNLDAVHQLSPQDGMATLAMFTAHTIADSAAWVGGSMPYWVICGGGRKNRFLMECLASVVDGAVVPAEAIHANGDAIEAEAWAYLAVRSLKGLPLTFPGTTGARVPVSGGVVYEPG